MHKQESMLGFPNFGIKKDLETLISAANEVLQGRTSPEIVDAFNDALGQTTSVTSPALEKLQDERMQVVDEIRNFVQRIESLSLRNRFVPRDPGGSAAIARIFCLDDRGGFYVCLRERAGRPELFLAVRPAAYGYNDPATTFSVTKDVLQEHFTNRNLRKFRKYLPVLLDDWNQIELFHWSNFLESCFGHHDVEKLVKFADVGENLSCSQIDDLRRVFRTSIREIVDESEAAKSVEGAQRFFIVCGGSKAVEAFEGRFLRREKETLISYWYCENRRFPMQRIKHSCEL